MGPQAAGARSPPGIYSQVFSREARDPLAALCGIFLRNPLPSLGISRFPNQDFPSPQTRSPGRSTGSQPLPPPTLPTFLLGPQPSRNLAAIVGLCLPSPLAGRGQGRMAGPHPPRPPRNLPWSRRRRPAPRRHLPAARGTCPRRRRPRAAYPAGGGASGGEAPLSPWQPRPAAPARRAQGRSADDRTGACPLAQGTGTARRVRGCEAAQDIPPGSAPNPRAPISLRPVRKVVHEPARVPGATPRPRPGFTATDNFPPPGLRPREPNAARDLKRRLVKSRPLNRLGCGCPPGSEPGLREALAPPRGGRGKSAPGRIMFTSLRSLLSGTPAAIVLTWGLRDEALN